ncbi:cartilage acidic protein 1-like isoform X2 [Acipenser oxyrinchus oxyrinchus]|uniref:Cartilage acidic protein 1-like isoform X2 n=1 Tax=Acipenser oxyrinchus oxyrinchus TaxID=40147 RepID=A0AAD8G5D3_ACIOX|nr:cartilage acidic protein 1-like isoform X2 [Acipenser oxyrinchus oxyrinchus]
MMQTWLLVSLLLSLSWAQRSEPMFRAMTKMVLPPDYENNPTQLNYGLAVTDVDGDGDLEVLVAGYNGPNLVLKYDNSREVLYNIAVDNKSSPFYALRDRQGNAIAVAACDIDGDGREEIYFLNTNNAFSGLATYSDKLFKFRNGRFEDLLSDDINVRRGVANRMAGRSVACLDRKGTGRYSIYIANYASGKVGAHALIEMDEAASDLSAGIIALSDVAEQAGVSKLTGGRGVVVGPIVSQVQSDIFCDNEYGPNFLFKNNGDGTFTDIAGQAGVDDPYQHGRGVALADFNRDGKTDIVYGNWNGPHRLFLQTTANRKLRFKDIATQKFAMPSPVRTVIVADFDNDQELEVFFNNIAYRGSSANRIFRVSRRDHADPLIEELNVGEAAEADGRGTGAAVTDFDGDGKLDLIVSHGESVAQPLSIYKVNQGFANNWLRVIPRTRFGSFARGAKVIVYTKKSGPHTRIIDGGSGYLCEMEPVAHFGLGKDLVTTVEVRWPDGSSVARPLLASEMNSVLEIPYPQTEGKEQPAEIECGQGFAADEKGLCTDKDECTKFPSVCSGDRPVCINTFGGYKCRPNKRCGHGFEPNEEGTACVAQVAYFGGNRSSSSRPSAGLPQVCVAVLGLARWLQA